jgi:hypothetical protein
VTNTAAEVATTASTRRSAIDMPSSSYPGLGSFAAFLEAIPQTPVDSALIQGVRSELSSIIRPVSSSALQAFGFLRIPWLERGDKGSADQPASKGT